MRSASASLALAAVATLSACFATSPRRLPPRRQTFAYTTAPLQRPPDLAEPAAPPIVDERYLYWTFPVDLAASVPLTYWMFRPKDIYLAMPSLLLPPLIHVAHGNSESAALSLVMRGAMLGAVYYAGRAAQTECAASDGFLCVPLKSVMLGELAIITPVVIDSVFLARRSRPADGWHRLPLIPAIGPAPGGGISVSLSSQY